MLEKIKKHKYIIFIILISLIYFVLTSVQNPLFKYELGDDDFFMVQAANSILNFKWMGKFVGKNLTKGPGAPIFIALTNVIRVNTYASPIFIIFGWSNFNFT